MGGRRRSLLWIALLCLVAVAAPSDALAGSPQRGALGAGPCTRSPRATPPDASVVTRVHAACARSPSRWSSPRSPARRLASASAPPGSTRAARGDARSRATSGRAAWRSSRRCPASSPCGDPRSRRRCLRRARPGPPRATTWQQAGYTVAGVKVGDPRRGFEGFASRLGSELPASVEALCFPDLGVSSPDLADCVTPDVTHGTAVAETIVDMAPNAQLFVSNANSQADKAAAISWMTANGVRVINYSQAGSLLLQGMGDGTSPYSNSDYALLDSAVSGGALFVASAGNSGQTTWTGTPSDANANGWVEFAGMDENDQITMEAGEVISVAARWASATSDYDLTLWDGDTLVASAQDSQAETGDPYEYFSFEFPAGGPTTFRSGTTAAPPPRC